MPPVDPLHPTTDLTPARWLVDAITDVGGRVEQLAPSGYAGHVRVFHRPDQGRPDAGTPASWAEVAERHGTTWHAEAQWSALTDDGPGATGRSGLPGRTDASSYEPLTGSLDPVSLARLAEVLERHTTTPAVCHYALWEGHGGSPRAWEEVPRFALPGRRHWLFPPVPVRAVPARSVELEVAGLDQDGFGSNVAVTTLSGDGRPADAGAWVRQSRTLGLVQSPSWWWPEDRAWVVHSEVDFDTTLVAGCAALCADLLADPGLECLPVGPTTSLLANADRVNDRYR